MVSEIQSINYILSNGLSGFRSEYFVDYLEQFNFIKDFYSQYDRVPDKITFVDKFPKFKIFEVSEPREAVVARLKEEAFAKKLIPVYNKCSEAIANGDSIQAASILEQQINKIREDLSDSDEEVVDITDLDYKISAYEELKEKLTLFSTGFPELDKLLGGWSSEDLVVLFARLGVGKSWVAIRYAYELVKQGKRVGFYAGEMSPEKLSLRMDSFNTNVSNFALQMGKLDVVDYREIAKQLSSLPGKMLVMSPKTLKRAATVDDIRRFIKKQKLDCVFIDQISLIKRNGKKSTHDAISEIANELRILQSVTQIPMFIVSQQNRASMQEGEVGAEHIAQSDDIGQNATIAIALEYDKETRILTQNIVKSRNSAVAKFSYLWDIDKGKMTFIPHEDSLVETKDETDYNDSTGRIF